MRVDNISTVRLATLQSQDWKTLQPSGWQHCTQREVHRENPHVILDDMVLCRRQTWQRCILYGIQRTHTPYAHMSWYRHVLRGTGCWDRGLSCEKTREDVPVLGVHIIALRWYFLDNKVLCFFFSVTACHIFMRLAVLYSWHTVFTPVPVKLCLRHDHLLRITH